MSLPIEPTVSAVALQKKFLQGEVSAKEIVAFYLKRVDLFEHKVDAFLSLFPEKAIKKAEELDAKRARGETLGPMAAIPVAIKDNIHIQGEITTCASKFLDGFEAPFSATAVDKLAQADAIFLGKTNLDEFAMGSSTEHSAYKTTKNPWDLACAPGGSSGGSAAAVAARLAPIALGTDTGGSIRQPGSLCGVVGFKPSYGMVSRFGLVAYGSSLDCIGPIAGTVEDAALTMQTICGPCTRDATSLRLDPPQFLQALDQPPQNLRVGVPWHFLEDLRPDIRKLFETSLKRLEDLGATLVDIDLDILRYSLGVYYIVATAEASTNLARFDGIRFGVRSKEASSLEEVYTRSKEEGYGEEVKRRILLGTYVLSSGFKDAYYNKALKVRTLMIEKYKEAFQTCDLIATPVSPIPAFPIGSIKDPVEMYLEDIFTIGANLAGLPAISVPASFTEDQKPFGLQLLGSHRQDASVLSVAKQFEQSVKLSPAIPEWTL